MESKMAKHDKYKGYKGNQPKAITMKPPYSISTNLSGMELSYWHIDL